MTIPPKRNTALAPMYEGIKCCNWGRQQVATAAVTSWLATDAHAKLTKPQPEAANATEHPAFATVAARLILNSRSNRISLCNTAKIVELMGIIIKFNNNTYTAIRTPSPYKRAIIGVTKNINEANNHAATRVTNKQARTSEWDNVVLCII